MKNQQLIDYIKKESDRGVPVETTKNTLLAVGWSTDDIKEAYEGSPKSPTSSGFSKKIIWIVLILFLLIGGGVFAYINYAGNFSSNTEDQALVLNETPVMPTENNIPAVVLPQAETPVVSDVDKVSEIMGEICQAYTSGDNTLLLKNSSTETADLLSKSKITKVDACSTNSVQQSGTSIIVNMTTVTKATPEEKTGASQTKNESLIFINETGSWKYDLAASIKFTTEQNRVKILTGDSEGLADLMVTDVTISPARAIVNKKDLKITITIKNIGTKTSEKGSPLNVNLEGFKDSIATSGGNYEPLLPGETTTFVWYPYKYNELLKLSDVAGEKTIKIELNPSKLTQESNYENNIFSKTMQVYAK